MNGPLVRKGLLILLALAVAGFGVRQSLIIKQLRLEQGQSQGKVENAFRYVLLHASDQGLPATLDKLAAAPTPDLFATAKEQAEEFTGLLMELNDLRDTAPPDRHRGLQWGANYYHSYSQEKDNFQFLRDAGGQVRRINDKLTGLRAAANAPPNWPNNPPIGPIKQQFRSIEPELAELTRLIKAQTY